MTNLKYISADYVFDGEHMHEKMAIALDEDGRIIKLLPTYEAPRDVVSHYRGYIFPGWVNAHCHLELSHMKSQLPTGTGLVDFIKGIVTSREAELGTIEDACRQADQEMFDHGIDAVGDISNTNHSFTAKSSSSMAYHTFIEVFDLMQLEQTEGHIQQALELQKTTPQKASIVPHAPYSCSTALLKALSTLESNQPISIHNQETLAEHEFFMSGTGELIDFYEMLGLDLSAFQPTGEPSLAYYLDHLPHHDPHLFVHNTEATLPEVARAMQAADAYWVTCPRANLYIESRLPNYAMLRSAGARICIGTDSLASNWSLDIWEEMRTIKRYHSYIPADEILSWGSAHGADALGLSDRLGRLHPGCQPGMLHLDTDLPPDEVLHSRERPRRLS